GSIPRPFESRLVRGGPIDLGEGAGFGVTFLPPPDSLEDLVAVLELSRVDEFTELLQVLHQTATRAAAHRPVLPAPRPTPCQQIVNLLPLEQLDLHLGIPREPLPPLFLQLGWELDQLAPLCGPPITAPARSEEFPGLIADHATVPHPNSRGLSERG